MACAWWVSTLVDTVDPRHAWMFYVHLSKYLISMVIHPRMAWIYWPPGNCRRRGGVGLRGVRGMDAAAKPPRMGLRRPRNPTPPRHPTQCRFGCCSGCGLKASAGAGRSPA
ncbi:hypothetical protein CR156_22425 [Stenotrophomonas lactitubi]|nr:hypothetical protein CR156_22425 [Stenotrophomonas lactitubi]